MSLQVWLPLTGDLHNQGLANVAVTNNGATIDNNGKIGKCYSFDGSDDFIKIESTKLTEIFAGGSQQFSVCMWIYNNETAANRAILFGNYTVSPSTSSAFFNIELMGSSNQIRYDWKANPDWNAGSNTVIPTGTWTHLCCSYDGTQEYVYLNGQLQANRSGVLPSMGISSDVIYYLGRDARTGATAFNGKLNDFRIYDHCLSQKEVEEIAKGLVLHYKLDAITNSTLSANLLLNSAPHLNALTSWSTAGTGWANSLVEDNTAPYGHVVRCTYSGTTQTAGGTHHPSSIDKTNLVTGDIYTLSGWIRASKNCICSFYNELMTTTKQVNVTTNWQYFSHTSAIDTSKTYQSNVFYCRAADAEQNMWVELKMLKLEKGSVATTWCPAQLDSIYNSYANNANIIYDSSGYNNNGNTIGDLTINTNSNTSRYNVSSSMNNTNTSNHIECINQITLPTDGITASIWVKTLKTQSQVIFAHPQIEFGTLNSLGYCHPNSNQAGWTLNNFINNEWNHIVVVRQNTTYQLYINGVLETQNGASNNYNHNKNVLWLLNRGNNNTYAANASISDFRLYATALTAEQILDLYHTSATIDNLGNVYSREYIETEKTSITKTGQFQIDKIYDNNDLTKASILKDENQIQGFTIYEY